MCSKIATWADGMFFHTVCFSIPSRARFERFSGSGHAGAWVVSKKSILGCSGGLQWAKSSRCDGQVGVGMDMPPFGLGQPVGLPTCPRPPTTLDHTGLPPACRASLAPRLIFLGQEIQASPPRPSVSWAARASSVYELIRLPYQLFCLIYQGRSGLRCAGPGTCLSL